MYYGQTHITFPDLDLDNGRKNASQVCPSYKKSLRDSRGEVSKGLPEVVLEEVPDESSSVYWPKAMSKASSFAAICCFAASITSCSADSWLEWKRAVVGVLSDRNSACR